MIEYSTRSHHPGDPQAMYPHPRYISYLRSIRNPDTRFSLESDLIRDLNRHHIDFFTHENIFSPIHVPPYYASRRRKYFY